MDLDPRQPVLVGVGVADGHDFEPAELMAQAAEAAAADAGVPTLLHAVGRVAVPQGNWSYPDPGRFVAERIGATDARTVLVDLGIPQQRLVNDALRAIVAGDLDVALVVGGEAKRRDAIARRAGAPAPVTDQAGLAPDEHQRPTYGEIVAPAEIEAGVVVPVQQYALIEAALRVAEGRTLDDDRSDIAELWARCNAVARTNEHAAFPEPRDAALLREPSAENRPLAFPYSKWHATQWTVDQAGALLLCSAEAALTHGVEPERFVFPRVALDSSHALSLSLRRDLHRWPAMAVLGRVAEEHLGVPLADLELVDLYSCFPSAVRVQQRELGLPLDGTPTVTGGMAFAGGPFNNYVLQSTAATAQRLRADRGACGLVTTVSGLLTKPGLAVWSTTPGDQPLLLRDVADEAAAEATAVEGVTGYDGPAVIASATVTYDDQTPTRVIVIADTPAGKRAVAVADDHDLATRATTDDIVGDTVHVRGPSFSV